MRILDNLKEKSRNLKSIGRAIEGRGAFVRKRKEFEKNERGKDEVLRKG